MNALHINGNDLTLEAVREVAVERRPVLLLAEARELEQETLTLAAAEAGDGELPRGFVPPMVGVERLLAPRAAALIEVSSSVSSARRMVAIPTADSRAKS